MTATQRLRPTIELTSPLGTTFSAKWRGDNRDIDRRIAVFSYPGVNGNVVQDLGSNSFIYPLTVFFDGSDHDITSNRFAIATRVETGTWAVIHPIYGFRELQLVRARFYEQPIRSGNITQVDTEWIEPIDPDTLQTGAEKLKTVEGYADITNASAADQFAKNTFLDNIADVAALKNVVGKVQAISDKVLGPVAAANNAVFSAFNATQRGIQDIINATVVAPLALAGQIQNLIQMPGLAISDIKNRLTFFKEANTEFGELAPGEPTARQRNVAATQELAMTSIATANAQTVARDPVGGGLRSRAQMVGAAQQINFELADINRVLEESQQLYASSPIEFQYFAQSESYSNTQQITSLAVQGLLSTAFVLSVEQRFVLAGPKSPPQIVIEHYGSLGLNDQNLDDFIDYNELHGDDILFVPAGREVVVYV